MQGLAASVRSTALGGAQSCVFLAFARRGATVLSAMALALTATAGCGSHESSGTGPTAPSAPSPTVTFLSLVLSGGSAFTGISETSQLVATARLSDNTERTVTTTATWQSSKTEVATVSSSGLVSTTGQLGSAVGVAVLGTVFFSVVDGQAGAAPSEMFRPAFEIALAALVVLMVVAAVVARTLPRATAGD